MTTPAGETQQDVGTVLRQRRMLRGQSLEAAFQHTRIPKRLLQALEENHFEDFPAPVYLRGFLKTYCDFLDVEFDPLWQQLRPAAPAQQEAAPKPASDAASAKPGDGLLKKGALPVQFTESTLMPAAIFVGLVLAGAVMWMLKGKPARPRPAAPVARSATAPAPLLPTTEPIPIATVPAPPPTEKPAQPAATPAAQPVPAANEVEPATLRITALREAWIRLKTDGKLRFEGLIPAGTSQIWHANAAFSLRAVDPQALRLELNGKAVSLDKLPAETDGSRTIPRG